MYSGEGEKSTKMMHFERKLLHIMYAFACCLKGQEGLPGAKGDAGPQGIGQPGPKVSSVCTLLI